MYFSPVIRKDATMKIVKSFSVLAGLVLGLLPAPGRAQTFNVSGQELISETRTVAGDGSVTILLKAGMNGSLYDAEENERMPFHGTITLTLTLSGNELVSSSAAFTQSGENAVTVAVPIDPCWFELANDREFTSLDFGADIVRKIEAAGAAINPCNKMWLQQRVALLAAKTIEPFLKAGTPLVPVRR
jgi:hypothetical protein